MTQQQAQALLHGLLRFDNQDSLNGLDLCERWLEAGLTKTPPLIPVRLCATSESVLWALPAGYLFSTPTEVLHAARAAYTGHPTTDAGAAAALILHLRVTGIPDNQILREASVLSMDVGDDFLRALHSVGHTLGWVNTRHALLHIGRHTSPSSLACWALCLLLRPPGSWDANAKSFTASMAADSILESLLTAWGRPTESNALSLSPQAVSLTERLAQAHSKNAIPPETRRHTSEG